MRLLPVPRRSDVQAVFGRLSTTGMTDVDSHIRQGEMMLRLCETLVQHAVAGWCAKPTTGGNPGCQMSRRGAPGCGGPG